LTAACSWVFYPNNAAPGGYLLVVGCGRPGASSDVPEITVIQPNGDSQVRRLTTIKVGTERNITPSY
jgi:hypothetical protein